ncbi:membrane metallo-endopeptidase-like 1 [Haemaphysalis longicornis]
MEPPTIANATQKLQKMRAKIGYQPWLLNTTFLEMLGKYIPQFKKNDTFLQIWLSIMRNNFAHALLLLRQSYNKTAEWTVGPTVVNAFYAADKNDMSYPSAILQGLFYTEGLPRSISFGGIGSVVGHELTHGFDNVGRQFDSYGELTQWWTNKSLKNFERKALCFVYQYGNICDAEAQMKLNGFNTVNENIADNGGVRTAYKAYERYFKQDCKHEDIRLKGLEDLSGKKLFFISHAMIWCTLSRTQELKNQIQYDVHSPAQYRVNVPLQNMRAFSRVFKCRDGARMNPGENKTCKLW